MTTGCELDAMGTYRSWVWILALSRTLVAKGAPPNLADSMCMDIVLLICVHHMYAGLMGFRRGGWTSWN